MPKRQYTDEQFEEAVRLVVDEGWTPCRAADEIGIARPTFLRNLRKHPMFDPKFIRIMSYGSRVMVDRKVFPSVSAAARAIDASDGGLGNALRVGATTFQGHSIRLADPDAEDRRMNMPPGDFDPAAVEAAIADMRKGMRASEACKIHGLKHDVLGWFRNRDESVVKKPRYRKVEIA